jgi:hypothetical protein
MTIYTWISATTHDTGQRDGQETDTLNPAAIIGNVNSVFLARSVYDLKVRAFQLTANVCERAMVPVGEHSHDLPAREER